LFNQSTSITSNMTPVAIPDVGFGVGGPPGVDHLRIGAGVLESVLGERALVAGPQGEHRPAAVGVPQRGLAQGAVQVVAVQGGEDGVKPVRFGGKAALYRGPVVLR
jgi:hypothetical protein